MPAVPLTEDELTRSLEALPGWTRDGTEIVRSLTAPDFLAGIAIVDEVARFAEELGHHPDIDIRWRTVRFALTTHDAGNAVTELDVAAARRINEIAERSGAR